MRQRSASVDEFRRLVDSKTNDKQKEGRKGEIEAISGKVMILNDYKGHTL